MKKILYILAICGFSFANETLASDKVSELPNLSDSVKCSLEEPVQLTVHYSTNMIHNKENDIVIQMTVNIIKNILTRKTMIMANQKQKYDLETRIDWRLFDLIANEISPQIFPRHDRTSSDKKIIIHLHDDIVSMIYFSKVGFVGDNTTASRGADSAAGFDKVDDSRIFDEETDSTQTSEGIDASESPDEVDSSATFDNAD